jgi:hypothetical protein
MSQNNQESAYADTVAMSNNYEFTDYTFRRPTVICISPEIRLFAAGKYLPVDAHMNPVVFKVHLGIGDSKVYLGTGDFWRVIAHPQATMIQVKNAVCACMAEIQGNEDLARIINGDKVAECVLWMPVAGGLVQLPNEDLVSECISYHDIIEMVISAPALRT